MATRNFVPRANNEGGIGTSVKQWASGFFQKLAVGAITTAVTVLTPSDDANNQQPATTGWVRSQFQSILKTVLTAAGLKYNIATNGYICFGALFGGLILQWGLHIHGNLFTPNIKVSETYVVLSNLRLDGDNHSGTPAPVIVGKNSQNNIYMYFGKSISDQGVGNWLIIGA